MKQLADRYRVQIIISMKEQSPTVEIQHCCCCCGEDVFQVPVSYEPSHGVAKIQTLLDTSDEEEDIRAKFQRYNPNLSQYLSKDAKPIYSQTRAKAKTKQQSKEKEAIDSNKKTVKNGGDHPEEPKSFEFKRFDYIDKRSACTCSKQKFTKFVWKPIFTTGYYSGTIPQYRVDENNRYIETKLAVEEHQAKKTEPSPPKVDAVTQTGKQAKQVKPSVSFGDISEVKPPKVKPPINDIIPKELEVSGQGGNKPSQPVQPVQPLQPQKLTPFRPLNPSKQQANKPFPKVRQTEASVFKQFQEQKYSKQQQQSSSSCSCPCHTKVCRCASVMKRQLLSEASKDVYFAERLISNARSEVCGCILAVCHCNCPLKHYQLPQYRLNPQNYQTLPANQMAEIPYAGKMRRYDFNRC